MAIEAVIVWLHLMSASIWVGGSLFIGIVLAPLLKTMYDSPAERIRIMIKVGRRFNKIAIPALLVLMGTGLYKAQHVLMDDNLLLNSNYGNIVLVKIILVVIMLGVYGLHTRFVRKGVEDKIMSGQMSNEQLSILRKKIIILGEVVVILSVIILFFAAVLDVGL